MLIMPAIARMQRLSSAALPDVLSARVRRWRRHSKRKFFIFLTRAGTRCIAPQSQEFMPPSDGINKGSSPDVMITWGGRRDGGKREILATEETQYCLTLIHI